MAGKRIDWSKWDHILGCFPDARIAELAGCTATAVSERRKVLGKKPHQPKSRPKRPDWNKVRERLGTVPDRVLADELGISRERVRQYRNQQGIASWLSSAG